MIRFIYRIFKVLPWLAAILIVFIFGVTVYMTFSMDEYIYSDVSTVPDSDCIIVLGCSVYGDEPSDMLYDRVERACELYKAGKGKLILMSGDHSEEYYDEVSVMVRTAVELGVDEQDILTDELGLSTYESMYRAKNEFALDNVIIVTQRYHLVRAAYIARKLGLNATGVESDIRSYVHSLYREGREMLARCKDMFFCIMKPAPEYIQKAQ